MKHEIRHCSYLSENLDSGNVCPACPNDNGPRYYAIDGLFGLPRKKAAGMSYRKPVHGSIFFGEQYYSGDYISQKITSGDTSSTDVDLPSMYSLEERLNQIEEKYHMIRWIPSDKQYREVEQALSVEKLQHLKHIIWTLSVKRRYLLRLKSKYADGQKIAKKISIQISKETSNIKRLLYMYKNITLALCVHRSLQPLLLVSMKLLIHLFSLQNCCKRNVTVYLAAPSRTLLKQVCCLNAAMRKLNC